MAGPVTSPSGRVILQDPPVARFLFADTRAAWIWLPIRILVGWQWFSSGWTKIGNPAWMDTGEALRGFWQAAVQVPETGRPTIAFEWYRNFLQSMLDSGSYTWFAKVIAIGEVLVGVALIIGAFVGVAAFFGAFMNWNYIMAGSASTNGLMGLAAIFLILAWKVAGWIGADYFLLRWLRTPWDPPPGETAETREAGRVRRST